MKNLIVLSILVLLTGCKSTAEFEPISQIKPSVAKEGSLANEKLVTDATASLRELVVVQKSGRKIN
jgi:hypothetical protein